MGRSAPGGATRRPQNARNKSAVAAADLLDRIAAYRAAVLQCLRIAETVADRGLKLHWALRAVEWHDEADGLEVKLERKRPRKAKARRGSK